MKNANVSVVLSSQKTPSIETIRQVDFALTRLTRDHEIIVVLDNSANEPNYNDLSTIGPVTVITTRMRSTRDQVLLTGLARAVGDFVIEWRGSAHDLDSIIIEKMLEPTDSGSELIEVVGSSASRTSKLFLYIVNAMRPPTEAVRKAMGRTYSRRALQQVLNTSSYAPLIDVIAAELPVNRQLQGTSKILPKNQLRQRFSDGLMLLSKGTRFGTIFPLLLALLSTCFGLSAAAYSLALFIVRGRAPEGWTTLMIAVGLGQAAILTTLAFIWSRINALTRGLSKDFDRTANLYVLTPKQPRV